MKQEQAAGRIKLMLAVLCMAAAGICYSCSRMDGQGADTRIVIGEASQEGESRNSEAQKVQEAGETQETERLKESAAEETQEPEELVYVHVCGQVVSPGVYQLLKGSRVYEAIALAGGCTEQGVPDCLNMAQEVTDGMKIQVPDQETARRILEEQPAGSGLVQPSGPGQGGTGEGQMPQARSLVNINTASREQLMTLPGIGESRAEDIIRYREEYGGFQKIEDIMKVSGIKEAAFQKIKDSITV